MNAFVGENMKDKYIKQAIAKQNICIYTKSAISESLCFDNSAHLGAILNIDNIDDSYGLLVEKGEDFVKASIPKGARVTLADGDPNVDCTVFYKNVECDLLFEEGELEDYFTII